MEITLKLPTPHEKQQYILDNAKRFNHLRCGRRFGKTHLINELTLPALDGHPIGVFYPTYKDSTDVWTSVKKMYRDLIKKKDETFRMLWLTTGGKIDFWAMDNPDSGQGYKYKRAIIDEAAKAAKFKQAWEETIRPTLTDFQGDAWVMSRPKPNTYFKQLEDDHNGRDDWAFFHYTTYDNPYILTEEVDAARRDLDPLTFDQEYMAEYVDPAAHYFLYTFEEDKHVQEVELLDDLPVKLSFDFNLEPFATIVYQTPDENTLNVIKEIRLNNSDIYQMCDHIKALYPDRVFQVTGDKSGYNRVGTTRGKTSYWQIVKKELGLKDFQIKLRGKNLDLLSSRILCNSAMYNKDITISPECVNLIKDCKYAIVDERGELIKDRNKNQNDFLDDLRYALDSEFPKLLYLK